MASGGEDGLIFVSIDGIARFPVSRPGLILVVPYVTGGLLIGPPKGGLKFAGGLDFVVHRRAAVRVEFVEAIAAGRYDVYPNWLIRFGVSWHW